MSERMRDRNLHFMNRGLWVLIHRWTGLAMAGFLILVGLTGSLLAFYPELERAINPHWYVEREPAHWRDAASLVERLEAGDPRARVVSLAWQNYAGVSSARISATTNPETGQPFTLEYRQMVFDPATGQVLDRLTGSFADGWGHLMGFVYSLHYALALDTIGVWVLGIIALAWTLDCFVGFYLTLPRPYNPHPNPPPSARRHGRESRGSLPCDNGGGLGRGWWQRWQPAWKIRWRAGGYKLNFDLHRAGGLWLWGPWSSFRPFEQSVAV